MFGGLKVGIGSGVRVSVVGLVVLVTVRKLVVVVGVMG